MHVVQAAYCKSKPHTLQCHCMDQGYRVPGLRPAWTTFVGGELSCSNVLRPNLPHLIFWATVIPLKCYVSNDAPENGGGALFKTIKCHAYVINKTWRRH